jgi:hypothetical protein
VVAQLVEPLHYKPEGRGFNSRWCHWNFLLTRSFRPHHGSNRNEYQEYFLGVKVAGTQGWQRYHLHVPTVLKSGSLNFLEPFSVKCGFGSEVLCKYLPSVNSPVNLCEFEIKKREFAFILSKTMMLLLMQHQPATFQRWFCDDALCHIQNLDWLMSFSMLNCLPSGRPQENSWVWQWTTVVPSHQHVSEIHKVLTLKVRSPLPSFPTLNK